MHLRRAPCRYRRRVDDALSALVRGFGTVCDHLVQTGFGVAWPATVDTATDQAAIDLTAALVSAGLHRSVIVPCAPRAPTMAPSPAGRRAGAPCLGAAYTSCAPRADGALFPFHHLAHALTVQKGQCHVRTSRRAVPPGCVCPTPAWQSPHCRTLPSLAGRLAATLRLDGRVDHIGNDGKRGGTTRCGTGARFSLA
jgi:hypothetical protein